MNCKDCGAQLKSLWLITSLYCPNDCDLKKNLPAEKKDVVVYFPSDKFVWPKAQTAFDKDLPEGKITGMFSVVNTPISVILQKKPITFLTEKPKVPHYSFRVRVEDTEDHGITVLDARIGNSHTVKVKPDSKVLWSDHPKFKPCK